MYRIIGAGLAMLLAGAATAGTLDEVKTRGTLNCGVNTGLVGFASKDSNGEWRGFDVGMCRAVAAAVLTPNSRASSGLSTSIRPSYSDTLPRP